MKKILQIVSYETGRAIKEINITGKSERQIEKLELAYNINLNHSLYFTTTKEVEK